MLDTFEQFRIAQTEHFNRHQGNKLFVVDVDPEDIWNAWLDGLAPEWRQHYTCNCCHNFVRKYGNVVTVDAEGAVTSAVWPRPGDVPRRYGMSMDKIYDLIEGAQITNVFAPEKRKFGVNQAGHDEDGTPWTHMFLYFQGELRADPNRFMSDARADRIGLDKTLSIPVQTLQEALTLLQSGGLYRASQFTQNVANLITLARHTVNNNQKWALVATHGPALCRLHSTVLGLLFDRIKEGASFADIQREWNHQLDPSQYGRAQTLPKQGNIEAAKAMLEKHGIVDSLDRRFATMSDLTDAPILWASIPVKSGPASLFDSLPARSKEVASRSDIPAQTMTWVKFARTVLRTAKSLQIRANPQRAMALVTVSMPGAKNILRWDNPLSWYYAGGGIDGEMKRRVKAAGGKYENNDIRFSLIWNNRNDLDVHASSPKCSHIYWGEKQSRWCGGYLDVDMNVRGETLEPVENIRWVTAPNGTYRCWVENFAYHGAAERVTPFTMEVAFGSTVHHVSGRISGTKSSSRMDVCSFRKVGNAITELKWGSGVTVGDVGSTQEWVNVDQIIPAPDQWVIDRSLTTHFFFLTKGATAPEPSKLFLPEMLKREYHPMRRVMEAYTQQATVKASPGVLAAGYGYNDQQAWNLSAKVDGQEYLIDRFE